MQTTNRPTEPFPSLEMITVTREGYEIRKFKPPHGSCYPLPEEGHYMHLNPGSKETVSILKRLTRTASDIHSTPVRTPFWRSRAGILLALLAAAALFLAMPDDVPLDSYQPQHTHTAR
jgi:hypothetical protein